MLSGAAPAAARALAPAISSPSRTAPAVHPAESAQGSERSFPARADLRTEALAQREAHWYCRFYVFMRVNGVCNRGGYSQAFLGARVHESVRSELS